MQDPELTFHKVRLMTLSLIAIKITQALGNLSQHLMFYIPGTKEDFVWMHEH